MRRLPGHCLLLNELLQGGEECGCRAIVFHKKAAPDGLIGKTCIVWQKGTKRGGWLLNMVRWSAWCEIYCGGKRRCGSLCSQGTPAAHFGGISKGWNRTDRLSGWIERDRGKDDKEGAPGGRPLARNVFDSIDSPHSNSFHN